MEEQKISRYREIFAFGDVDKSEWLQKIILVFEIDYRSQDPQIGRFWQIDPKPNELVFIFINEQ
jgi:hypothetical protein